MSDRLEEIRDREPQKDPGSWSMTQRFVRLTEEERDFLLGLIDKYRKALEDVRDIKQKETPHLCYAEYAAARKGFNQAIATTRIIATKALEEE